MYTKYMNMHKFDIIAKIRDYENKISELEKSRMELENEVKSLKKTEELKNYKSSNY